MKVAKRTLEEKELELIKSTQGKLLSIKTQIGDLEIKKQNLMYHYNEAQQALSKTSEMLRARYGNDAIIDVKTGEVTYPQEDENKRLHI